MKCLEEYELPVDLDQIKGTSTLEWRNTVQKAIEKRNRTRLVAECNATTEGISTPKTKTAHIVPFLNETSYTRKPLKVVQQLSKKETRTFIMARYGMLECGKNFKGTLNEICSTCLCPDNEEHRLNECPSYKDRNYHSSLDKIKFETIFSEDIGVVKEILTRINAVWNTHMGRGSMNTL